MTKTNFFNMLYANMADIVEGSEVRLITGGLHVYVNNPGKPNFVISSHRRAHSARKHADNYVRWFAEWKEQQAKVAEMKAEKASTVKVENINAIYEAKDASFEGRVTQINAFRFVVETRTSEVEWNTIGTDDQVFYDATRACKVLEKMLNDV